jgi:hypothetical protein
VPVHEREIHSHPQAFIPDRVHVFTNKVAARGLFRRAVICKVGVKEAEPVVMLGRHNHVLHAGIARQTRPFSRRVGSRVELFGQLLVFLDGNIFDRHHPFAPAQNAVQAKMDEHPEFCLSPPLHAALVIGRLLEIRVFDGRF